MLEELFGVSFNLVKESNSEQPEYEQDDYNDEDDYDDEDDDEDEDLKDLQDSILDNNKTQHIQKSVVYNEGVNVQSVTNYQNARTTVTTSKGVQKSLSNATLLARSENNQRKLTDPELNQVLEDMNGLLMVAQSNGNSQSGTAVSSDSIGLSNSGAKNDESCKTGTAGSSEVSDNVSSDSIGLSNSSAKNDESFNMGTVASSEVFDNVSSNSLSNYSAKSSQVSAEVACEMVSNCSAKIDQSSNNGIVKSSPVVDGTKLTDAKAKRDIDVEAKLAAAAAAAEKAKKNCVAAVSEAKKATDLVLKADPAKEAARVVVDEAKKFAADAHAAAEEAEKAVYPVVKNAIGCIAVFAATVNPADQEAKKAIAVFVDEARALASRANAIAAEAKKAAVAADYEASKARCLVVKAFTEARIDQAEKWLELLRNDFSSWIQETKQKGQFSRCVSADTCNDIIDGDTNIYVIMTVSIGNETLAMKLNFLSKKNKNEMVICDYTFQGDVFKEYKLDSYEANMSILPEMLEAKLTERPVQNLVDVPLIRWLKSEIGKVEPLPDDVHESLHPDDICRKYQDGQRRIFVPERPLSQPLLLNHAQVNIVQRFKVRPLESSFRIRRVRESYHALEYYKQAKCFKVNDDFAITNFFSSEKVYSDAKKHFRHAKELQNDGCVNEYDRVSRERKSMNIVTEQSYFTGVEENLVQKEFKITHTHTCKSTYDPQKKTVIKHQHSIVSQKDGHTHKEDKHVCDTRRKMLVKKPTVQKLRTLKLNKAIDDAHFKHQESSVITTEITG